MRHGAKAHGGAKPAGKQRAAPGSQPQCCCFQEPPALPCLQLTPSTAAPCQLARGARKSGGVLQAAELQPGNVMEPVTGGALHIGFQAPTCFYTLHTSTRWGEIVRAEGSLPKARCWLCSGLPGAPRGPCRAVPTSRATPGAVPIGFPSFSSSSCSLHGLRAGSNAPRPSARRAAGTWQVSDTERGGKINTG